MVRKSPLTPEAALLLREIEADVPKLTTDRKDWPGTAERFGHALRRVAPNLRAEGVEIEFGKRTANGRLVMLQKKPKEPADGLGSNPDGLPDGLVEPSGETVRNPRLELPLADGSDGSDGSPLIVTSAYIPPDSEDEIEGKNTEKDREGRAFERVGERPSEPSYRQNGAYTAESDGGSEARNLLWAWLAERGWPVLQPKGGLTCGGSEEAWTSVFELRTDAQLAALWALALAQEATA